MKNLHVVFTMNPSTDGLKDRAATSPALFNRCVLNWFGDWSNSALYQGEFIRRQFLVIFPQKIEANIFQEILFKSYLMPAKSF